MVSITITASTPEELQQMIENMAGEPIITTDLVNANEMFNQMHKWFTEKKKKGEL